MPPIDGTLPMTGEDGMPAQPGQRRRSLAGGAAFMVAFKLIDRLVGMVSLMILARMLAPADFGLMAMAVSLMALIELMSAFGFDTALIQRQNAERRHFDTAWTFQLMFGLATAVLLVALAIPAAAYYDEPRIAWILPALAVAAMIGGLSNVGIVMFRKNMDFAREFRFMLTNRLLGFAVTVSLALMLRSFWALVLGMIAGKTIHVVMSYAMHPYRPRPSLQARHDLFGFSKWILLSSVLSYLQSSADKVILGRTIGAQQLGLYNMAYEIANLPSTAVIAPINRAAYPAYSALNGDLDALRPSFLRTFGAIAIIAVGASVLLAALAEPTVRVLLGTNWSESVAFLRWFVVCGAVGALQSNLFVMLLAIGRPAINTRIQAIVTAIYIPALIALSSAYGAQGALAALVGSAVLGLIPLHINFFRETGVRPASYFATLLRPALAGALAGGVAYTIVAALKADAPTLPAALTQLAVAGAAGLVVYVASLAALWAVSGRSAAAPEVSLWNLSAGRVHAWIRGPRHEA